MKTSPIIHWVLRDSNVRGNILRSITVLAGCSLIGLVFDFWGLSEANIITIYILGILLISAITSRWMYGMFSSVAGVLLFNCLYADPRFTLLVYDPQYTITIIIMLLASLVTSYVMNLLRGELSRGIQTTRRSEILLETSKKLQDADSLEYFYKVSMSQLSSLLNRPVLLFPYAKGGLECPVCQPGEEALRQPADMLAAEVKLAEWALSQSSNDTLVAHQKDGGRILFFKARTRTALYAVISTLLPRGEDLTSFEENLIFAMLDEIAFAIERFHLHQINEQIARTADEERLRSTLLRTISHDLRTPLTGIQGNADILLQSGRDMTGETRESIYRDIREDARWLVDLVENLLFVTRLESGGMPVRLEPEILQDVLNEALRLAAKRDGESEIRAELPEELLLVDADAQLLVQVVLNLLDNAQKFAPPGSWITLRAFVQGGQAVVEVVDTGPGIPFAEKDRVFEMFYTAGNHTGDGRRGLGLGLALCKAIVTAHGGKIYARDNTPTGSIIGFTLEKKEVAV